MIALIDLFAFVFSILALGLIIIRPAGLTVRNHLIILLLLGATAFINVFSANEWLKSFLGQWTELLTGTEMMHDYFQPLQALCWVLLFYSLCTRPLARSTRDNAAHTDQRNQ